MPPEPWAAVEPVLAAELGRPVGEVFTAIDPEPLAAASVAQIHAATLRDGTAVVVKIQRPAARGQVTADLDIVARLARRLARHTGWARNLGVQALADGFAQNLTEELDYRVELANMQAIAAAGDGLAVPRPYPRLSGPRVLVMQRLSGRPLTGAAAALAALGGPRRAELAEQLLTAVLRQMMVTGVFHADLHPGNIFLTSDGALALLDFGAVGRLDRGQRTALATLLLAVDRHDAAAATAALTDLLHAPADLDQRRLADDLGQLIMKYAAGPAAAGGAQLFADLFTLVLGHHLAVPAPIAAAFRALGALEGSLYLLTGTLDLIGAARSKGRALMREQLAPAQLRAGLELQLAALMPVLQRLPRRIDRIADQLQAGTLTITLRALAHPDDRAFLTGLAQQLIVAGLAAALALGGVLLVIADTGPTLARGLRLYTFLGAILLLFAFVLGSRALALIFRHQPAHRE